MYATLNILYPVSSIAHLIFRSVHSLKGIQHLALCIMHYLICSSGLQAQPCPPLNIAVTQTANVCNQEGVIALTVSQGVAPYRFTWSNGATTRTLEKLSAGTYTVTVTDQLGCSVVRSIKMEPRFQVSVSPCGTIVPVGRGPFSYSWPTGNPNPLPGTYTVTVTDIQTGCTATVVTKIQLNPPICFDIGGTVRLDANKDCQPQANELGQGDYIVRAISTANRDTLIAVSTTDGRYALPVRAGEIYVLTTSPLRGTAGAACGGITVTVPPTAGLTGVDLSATPQPRCANAVNYTVRNIACHNIDTGGVISLQIDTTGVGPYTISWADAPGVTTKDRTNLASGTYRVTVTFDNGCTQSVSITVGKPAAMVAVVNSFGFDCRTFKGGLTVLVTGGSGPYKFQWSNGRTIPRIDSLDPGIYRVTITDINGCTAATTPFIVTSTNCQFIEGTVRLDVNKDCQPQPNERGLNNYLIQAVSTVDNDVYQAVTDQNGRYTLPVRVGVAYIVTASPLGGSNRGVCGNGITVTVPNDPGNVRGVDFSAKPGPECAKLTVDLAVPLLRRCFGGNIYYLKVCNDGALAATGAYVDVTLDSLLSLGILTAPVASLGANTYRFPLGTVEAGECRKIQIPVTVSCQAVLGQAHCSKARVYPDSVCGPVDPQWSGAKIEARSQCRGNEVWFVLKNTGRTRTAKSVDYIVIEDGIMARRGRSGAPLGAGDSLIVKVPANGSTWRIESEQEPFAPFISQPAVSIEGCTTTGSFSTGFVTQFPNQERGPWEDVDCTVNRGSFDPNDKQGLPTGYGANRYIRADTDLEYMIRFQNTGTDTAFTVIVRDTLSSALDASSVRPGASSHPYVFTLRSGNVLEFVFKDIMLPDSNVNSAGSMGFVNFAVSQQEKMALESPILNRAAIFFDFNAPIITNTTMHRVGELFLLVKSWEAPQTSHQVRIAPHPVSTSAVMSIDAALPVGDYLLQIFDLTGRMVKTCVSQSPQFTVDRSALSSGLYVFRIARNGAPVGMGKMVVE